MIKKLIRFIKKQLYPNRVTNIKNMIQSNKENKNDK